MELVPRIASNIDTMLARHDIVGGVEQLSLVGGGDGQSVDKVNRVRQGRGRGRGGNSFRGKSFSNFTRKKPFCPECHLLGRKLQSQWLSGGGNTHCATRPWTSMQSGNVMTPRIASKHCLSGVAQAS